MRFTKPAWVAHYDSSAHDDMRKEKRVSILSVSVHPDGSRIATGAVDKKIRIWATGPILSPELEERGVPKTLCVLSMHTGAVMTVRWASNGKWLASGSDDTIVMVWDLDPNGGGKKVWGTEEINLEGWKPLKRLVGHESGKSHVTDLAWAPKDRFLASVGLDAKTIIWDGYNLQKLRILGVHEGFVKGVCWDPVGEFLATASDDKSVRVWRTTDWGLEATITKPFEDSGGSTFFLRLSWSPDGAHITASNATNNSGMVFVAAVISRHTWTSEISLVGHVNTLEVACYNPHIFLRNPSQPVTTSNICSVVALGADDHSISIWQTKSARPLIVAKEAFERIVLDLCWSSDGLTLYACSSDGTLAVFDFDKHEMEGIADASVQDTYLKKFGFIAPQATAQQQQQQMQISSLTNPTSSSPFASSPVQQQSQPVTQLIVGSPQRVSTAKNGKRRIQPSFLGGLGSSGISITPFGEGASADVRPFRSSTLTTTGGVSGSVGGVAGFKKVFAQNAMQIDEPVTTGHGGITPPTTTIFTSDGGRNFDPFTGAQRVGGDIGTDLFAGAPRNTGAGPGSNSVDPLIISSAANTWDALPTASDVSSRAGVGGSGSGAGSGRARTLGGDRVREAGPGAGGVRILSGAATTEGVIMVDSGAIGGSKTLNVPPLRSYLVKKLEGDGDGVIEARNREEEGTAGKPTEVVFTTGKTTQWLDFPHARIAQLVLTGVFAALVLEDGSVNVYSHTGRRIMPTMTLSSPCAFFEGCKSFLMAITADCRLHVWNVKSQRAAFPSVSLFAILRSTSILTATLRPNGAPLLHLDNGTAQAYDSALETWVNVADTWWAEGSDAWEGKQRVKSSNSAARNVLVSLEGAVAESYESASGSAGGTGAGASAGGTPTWWGAALTLGHLESRLHAAKVLDTPPQEYRHNLLLYAKRISEEGFRGKAEELLKELCGPVYVRTGREEAWCPTILGMSKRDLLKDVLSTFVRSKTLAKLAQDWQDTLKRAAAEE